MRSPPPKGKMLLIGSEDIEVYPQYCGDGHKCVQCYFNGKYLCAPRFWLYPTLGDCYGYPAATKSIWLKSAVRLSAVNKEDRTLLSVLAEQPLIPMPDGGYVAELTERIKSTITAHRYEPDRITDTPCNKCGCRNLAFLCKGSPREDYRDLYYCPQCGKEQIEDNKLLLYRIPDTVKPLLRELRGQGLSRRATTERIQQELGIKLSRYCYDHLLRGMGLPLSRKLERQKGISTVAQTESRKRNLLKTPAHRVKALREALAQQ